MHIEDVLQALKDSFGNIKTVRDGFVSLPNEHCFAVWRISHRKADGADEWNLYWSVTYELRIFYRENKTLQDVEKEAEFEKHLRECRELESDYEYDDGAKLDITVYKFTDDIDFEEEI